jgi:protein required for attachment to host cells
MHRLLAHGTKRATPQFVAPDLTLRMEWRGKSALVPLPADNTGRIKETKMLLPHGTVIAVIDARNFRLFRNTGDEASPELAETDAPRLDTHNHSGGSHHGSTITMAHDAHATAAIEYLAQEVQSRRIEHLVVIAARAALANCARPIPRAGGCAAG